MKNFHRIMLALLTLASGATAQTITVPTPSLTIVTDSVADTWRSEAFPIGNGYMGAMIYGGVASDIIQINEHSLWSGGPGANAAYNGGHTRTAEQNKTSLQAARNALQTKMTAFSTNDFAYINDAGQVVAKNYAAETQGSPLRNNINGLMGDKTNFGSYQTLGNINIAYPSEVPAMIVGYANTCESNHAGEMTGNLFDGNYSSKWYAADNFQGAASLPISITWEYDRAKNADSYSLVSGGDVPDRDPKSWKIYGSNTGEDDYILLDTVTNAVFNERNQVKTFNFSVAVSAVSYKYYKLEITALAGNPASAQPQLSEIVLNNSTETSTVTYSGYERTLDIDNALVTVSYTEDGTDFAREYFMSYPKNVMAMRLTASQAGKLSRVFWISTPQSAVEISAAGNVITMTGKPADQSANGLKFAQQIKIINTGGTISADGKRITVENADEILVLMSAATNYVQCIDNTFNYFSAENPQDKTAASLAAVSDYAALKAEHIQDYKSLYDRLKLTFGNISAPENNTRKLLEGLKNNTNTTAENLYLEMLYYQFGRYLLISSSRENTLPANLQGVWAEGLNPDWASDYHTNINLQMNYWLAEPTNLAECHAPMIKYVQSLVPRGTQTAQRYYCKQDGSAVRGWVVHHENNIWGNTAPGNWYDGFYFPAAAAWICQDIWEHYQFSGDRQFLQDNFPALRDAALFWVDNLWADSRDGSLVANPSYSPEHGAYSLGASCDQAIIWELFDFVLKAADVLGENSSEINEIKTAKSRLAGPQIGLAGQFMEWKDEVAMDISGDGHHRHANHLFWLHPGSQIVAGRSVQDSLYAAAMKKTLNTRGDDGTGWSMAWKLNFWARLRDGNRAHTLLKSALNFVDFHKPSDGGKGGVFANLLDVHPTYIFQIDGNLGATAGMTEMLIQSQGGYIELLPSLPSDWNTGAFKGIKARGNFEISAEWAGGELDKAEITSNAGNVCALKFNNASNYTITEQGGSTITPSIISDNEISFETESGKTYEVIKN
ncbi:MAG: glycoside hydrolase N-terminal domain-containing protein [Prevotellaceae bacterium]|jgi:hypothetical protein|nr:glycoside hydrolase N-terminal domain-containing protein [Prevotellaceae bacterium]